MTLMTLFPYRAFYTRARARRNVTSIEKCGMVRQCVMVDDVMESPRVDLNGKHLFHCGCDAQSLKGDARIRNPFTGSCRVSPTP